MKNETKLEKILFNKINNIKKVNLITSKLLILKKKLSVN